MNTLSKGHCHSHEYIFSSCFRDTSTVPAENTEKRKVCRNAINETGAAASQLTFNNSASSHAGLELICLVWRCNKNVRGAILLHVSVFVVSCVCTLAVFNPTVLKTISFKCRM